MRVMVTAGPTREYLDDVRYLSNASSGRMGYAVCEALLAAGHEVELVSGPVALTPPAGCRLHPVETTAEMSELCLACFPVCDGVIAAAAVCDYMPRQRHPGKLSKDGEPISVEMIETDDVLARLGGMKEHRWVVGFALEAENLRAGALQKLRAKNCDAVVVNTPAVIGAERTSVELIDREGRSVAAWDGTKKEVAVALVGWIDMSLADR